MVPPVSLGQKDLTDEGLAPILRRNEEGVGERNDCGVAVCVACGDKDGGTIKCVYFLVIGYSDAIAWGRLASVGHFGVNTNGEAKPRAGTVEAWGAFEEGCPP